MIAVTILSALLLAIWLAFFLVKIHKDRLLVLALTAKILAGIGLGLLYKYYYPGGDTWLFYEESGTIADVFLTEPQKWILLLFQREVVDIPGLVFWDQPRALFFSWLLSVPYLVSGGNYWLMSIMLSIVSFLCIKQLVDTMIIKFSSAKVPAYIAFYFLPTFVFWTSGILKESIAIGAMAVLIASTIKLADSDRTISWRPGVSVVVSGIVLWSLKYFIAAVVLPILISIVAYQLFRPGKTVRLAVYIMALVALVAAFSTFHYNLSWQRMGQVIYENYLLGIRYGGGSITYFHFDGSAIGFLINLPIAAFSGLFRPLIVESHNTLQVIVALENTMVLALGFWAWWKNGLPKAVNNPWILATLIMIAILDVAIAFSTPNFGTLSRFKTAYWPFFVLLTVYWFTCKKQKPGPESPAKP